MRKILVAAMTTAIGLATVAPSFAQDIPSQSQIFRRPGGGEGGPFRGGGGGGGHGGGFQGGGGGGWHGGGGGGHWRHGHNNGAAIGAGIAGLAAGAIIGGAVANQNGYYADPGYGAPVYDAPPPPPPPAYAYEPADSDADGYCAQRYRSYDPRSGTYLGNDGYRHPCP